MFQRPAALPLSNCGECLKVKCSIKCLCHAVKLNAVKCNAEAICREEPVGSLPLEGSWTWGPVKHAPRFEHGPLGRLEVAVAERSTAELCVQL